MERFHNTALHSRGDGKKGKLFSSFDARGVDTQWTLLHFHSRGNGKNGKLFSFFDARGGGGRGGGG